MSPATIHTSSSFLITVADAAARSILLGCFAAALLAAFRVKSVRMKMLAWRGVLIAALSMPLLIVFCPEIPLPVFIPDMPAHSAAVRAEAPQSIAAYPSGVATAVRIPPSTAELVPMTSRPASAPEGVPALSREYRQIPWLVLALAGYLAIVLAFFLRLTVGIRYGKRLQDAATSIRDARAAEILSAASRAAGLNAIPRLAESEMLSVPLMLGVRKPAILLPAGWPRWDDEEFVAVLAHELSHVERRDALWQRLALVHRAIFWFSPLSWWLERHLADLSEQASDEAALAGGADRTRYAETLLGFFAELEAAPERVWWHGVAMAKAGQAGKRVERILSWRNAMSNRLTKALAIWLVICAAPVVALTASLHPSFFSLRAQQIPALPPPPPPKLAPPADPSASAEPESAPLAAVAPLPNLPNDPNEPSASDAAPNVLPLPPLPQVAPAPPVAQVPVTPPTPPTPAADWGNWNWGANWPWGSRFVIVTPGSEPWMMSGSGEDKQHAKSLSDKIPGDFIWFERDEKSYIIRDPATIDRAKKLWAQQNDVSRQQDELRKKEEALGKQMREQVQQKMADVRVKVPDLTAQLQKLQYEVKNLSASGATMQQLGDLQREVGELQQALGETGWETRNQWSDVGRQAGELGRQMGEIGRQIGELARQQVEKSREAAEQMQHLLDDAIVNGTAKPE
jgi:beta-lactamase regulating signal transducer with metallopeptidase domain